MINSQPFNKTKLVFCLEEWLPLLAQLSVVDGEMKTLADLAAADRRSPFHLQRIFTAEVGEVPDPAEWLTEIYYPLKKG